MYSGRMPVLALILVAAVGSAIADEMARIRKSKDTFVTSSTLQWMDVEPGKELPKDALTVSPNGPIWCRSKEYGPWVAGVTYNGVSCQLVFLKQVYTTKDYQVLVSIDGSARLIGVQWHRLEALPANAVMISKKSVLASGDGEVGGYVEVDKRQTAMVDSGNYTDPESATIITEDEPKHYLLDEVDRDEDRGVLNDARIILANITISNNELEEKEVEEMVDYTQKEMLYWGRAAGTITGASTTVTDPSGRVRGLTWGSENEFDLVSQQAVKYTLPAGTGVKAELIGIRQQYEVPYSGKLTAVYQDENNQSRRITSLHIHRYLAELQVEFKTPYFLSNNTDVPGLSPTSNILVHSTTTTTTSTTTTTTPSPNAISGNTMPTAQEINTTGGCNVISSQPLTILFVAIMAITLKLSL